MVMLCRVGLAFEDWICIFLPLGIIPYKRWFLSVCLCLRVQERGRGCVWFTFQTVQVWWTWRSHLLSLCWQPNLGPTCTRQAPLLGGQEVIAGGLLEHVSFVRFLFLSGSDMWKESGWHWTSPRWGSAAVRMRQDALIDRKKQSGRILSWCTYKKVS